MKSHFRNFAAAIFAASLTFSAFPLAANDEVSSEVPSVVSEQVSETSSEVVESDESSQETSDDSNTVNSTIGRPDSNQSAPEEMPLMPQLPDETHSRQLGDSSASSSETSEAKTDIKKFINYPAPSFSQETNKFTSEFELLEVPEFLTFQFNWVGKTDGQAQFDQVPEVTVNGTSITPKATENNDPKLPTLHKTLYTFTPEQIASFKPGDKIKFVFQAYPGFENEQIATTSQVFIEEDGYKLEHPVFTQQETKFEIISEWKNIEYDTSAGTNEWVLTLEPRVKPKELKMFFVSNPDSMLIQDGKAVTPTITIDGKTISDSTVELKKESDIETDSQSTTQGVYVTVPQSAVDAMSDPTDTTTPKIKVAFKLNTQAGSNATITARIDNGIHPVTYTTKEFGLSLAPVTGHDYDKNNQTWTANLTLKSKPKSMKLTFTQMDGTYLDKVKSVKIGDKVVEPEVETTTTGDNKKQITVTFKEDQVNEMNVDTKLSLVFGITPPESGTGSEKILMAFDDGSFKKDYTATFKVEKFKAPSSTGAKTSTQTGLYALIAVFVVALLGLCYVFFASKKKKKDN